MLPCGQHMHALILYLVRNDCDVTRYVIELDAQKELCTSCNTCRLRQRVVPDQAHDFTLAISLLVIEGYISGQVTEATYGKEATLHTNTHNSSLSASLGLSLNDQPLSIGHHNRVMPCFRFASLCLSGVASTWTPAPCCTTKLFTLPRMCSEVVQR